MIFMDNEFAVDEKLYRAVYPPSYGDMYWKKDGTLSSAAFIDRHGLSVERGNFRQDNDVIEAMKQFFTGRIVSFTVQNCKNVEAVVKYKPTKRSQYHSEVHGSEDKILLSPSQRKKLAKVAKIEYYQD